MKFCVITSVAMIHLFPVADLLKLSRSERRRSFEGMSRAILYLLVNFRAAQLRSSYLVSSAQPTAPSGSYPSRPGNWEQPSYKALPAGRRHGGSMCDALRK